MQPRKGPAAKQIFAQLVGGPCVARDFGPGFVALMMGVMIGHDRQFRTPSGQFSGGSTRCGRFSRTRAHNA